MLIDDSIGSLLRGQQERGDRWGDSRHDVGDEPLVDDAGPRGGVQ